MELLAEIQTPVFWAALLAIIWVNIILSGDNAVVIALAARSLPPHQRQKAVFWGAGAAVLMRIGLTIVAVELLKFPFLKIIGGLLLLWIAVKLLMPEAGGDQITGSSNLMQAVKTILVADLVMSVDNVIAVASAAQGSVLLLVLGLVISIPLVIFGATMLMKLMERFPLIVTLGAAILGWVAGEMMITDPIVVDWIDANARWIHFKLPEISWAEILGAAAVVVVGKWLAARSTAASAPATVVDLATGQEQPEVPPARTTEN
ncbi:MAG: TerC family protein [Betaproteobacteria bacterium]|nr:TerC family protein [Betaproteobacteria bacterium]